MDPDVYSAIQAYHAKLEKHLRSSIKDARIVMIADNHPQQWTIVDSILKNVFKVKFHRVDTTRYGDSQRTMTIYLLGPLDAPAPAIAPVVPEKKWVIPQDERDALIAVHGPGFKEYFDEWEARMMADPSIGAPDLHRELQKMINSYYAPKTKAMTGIEAAELNVKKAMAAACNQDKDVDLPDDVEFIEDIPNCQE